MTESENLRFFACDIIQHAGILLRLPQAAMATAQMLLQRVYHSPGYSFDKYPLDVTAMAALFLATKIEECPRKAYQVMDVFTHVISSKLERKIVLSYTEHEKLREELITFERRLLKKLGFNLLSNSPHKIIVTYYNAMVNVLDKDHNVWIDEYNRKLLQIAWNYCNDSLRTDIFVKYSNDAVACACVQLACEDTQMLFPTSTEGKEWYQLFIKDEKEVELAIQMIKNLYQREPISPHKFEHYLYLSKIRVKR